MAVQDIATTSGAVPAQKKPLESPLILVVLAFLAIHLVWGSTYIWYGV